MRPDLRPCLSIAIASLLALSVPAFAQQPAASAPPIEQEMSTEEFKAAGLDKLSSAELARLNAWLDRKVDAVAAEATEKAREEGRQEVKEENRGFFHFGSKEPIAATMTSTFKGFGKGRRYTLDNGQTWEQTDTATLYGVRDPNPSVEIKPGMVGNVWYMKVKGYNKRAKVKRIK